MSWATSNHLLEIKIFGQKIEVWTGGGRFHGNSFSRALFVSRKERGKVRFEDEGGIARLRKSRDGLRENKRFEDDKKNKIHADEI